MIGSRLLPWGSAVKSDPHSDKYRLPSHRRSPRVRLRTIIIGSCLLAIAAVGLLLFLYPPLPPMSLLSDARNALESASKVGALRYSETLLRSAEGQVQEGWLEIARQNGRLAPFRNYAVADSILLTAIQTAQDAARKAREMIGNLSEMALSDRSELKAELESWQDALNGSLAKLNVKRYWSSAELALSTGDKLLGQSEYDEARQSFALGHTWLTKLGAAMTKYDNDEVDKLRMWRRWVVETVEESRTTNAYAIIVDKADHKSYLLKGGKVIKAYSSELGYNSASQKLFSGDGATPEGRYRVTVARHRGSRYYKALLINFPNEQDEKRFRDNKDKGMISKRARVGGLIEIHGEGGRGKDWTEGCVALTNKDMDHLMQFVTVGTPVTIVRKSDQWP